MAGGVLTLILRLLPNAQTCFNNSLGIPFVVLGLAHLAGLDCNGWECPAYTDIHTYPPTRSECGLLHSIWLDSKNDVKQSDSEAKSEAKPKRGKAKRKAKRSRSEAID